MSHFLRLSLLVWLLFLSTCAQTNNDDFLPKWKWTCQNDQCVREVGIPAIGEANIEACRLSCGPFGGLWPLPTGEVVLSGTPRLLNLECIDTDTTGIVGDEAQAFLIAATKRLQAQLRIQKHQQKQKKRLNRTEETKRACLRFEITTTDGSLALDWTTDEAFNLQLDHEGKNSMFSNNLLVKINSATAYGARHGIETVGQLIGFHFDDLIILDHARISDRPMYPHRGLMIDTARHFISIETIKKQIEAMAASKLNVLHWHITDSQSFPLLIPSRPKLTSYGAYSSDQIYTPEDIRLLREFSLERGIRILIEIDAPAHASFGWQWGPEEGLGDLAVCVNAQPWRQYCVEPPCGQLNPTNPNVYKVLRQIYRHILDIWDAQTPGAPPVLFHMGGDEVHIGCWNSTPSIVEWMKNKGRPLTKEGFLNLWADFQATALRIWDEETGNHVSPIILWTSDLTNPKSIRQRLTPDRYVIEVWTNAGDTMPNDLLDLGYGIILATRDVWYLDHGFWGSTKFSNWKRLYENTIPSGTGVFGGECAMWTEFVDNSGIDARIWPRAAAFAERIWSNPSTSKTSTSLVEERLVVHRQRLVQRGLVAADIVNVEFCEQNSGQCG